MLIAIKKTDKVLKEKGISHYKLSKLIKKDEGFINRVFRGEKPFSKPLIKKLLPILEVSKEEFETWVLADKYSKELLELAIQEKKAFPYKRKSILTTKIDALLEERKMSRTDLSKEIKYSQSGLNRMIVRKISMSEPVLQKVAAFFEIPQDAIRSWIVADRHKLEVLQEVYRLKKEF